LPLREEDVALHRGSEKDLAPILLVTADESSRGCVERLQHEYALKSELHADWRREPSRLRTMPAVWRWCLRIPGGTPLDRLLGSLFDMSHFLRIAIPLAGALRHVHERGLVHKETSSRRIA
jgi:hypothetical protein